MSSRRSRALTTALACFLAVSMVASCGSSRSVESFCETFHEENRRLNDKYNAVADATQGQGGAVSLLVAFGSMVEAQGDLVVVYDRLERNAPEEIAPDVAAMRDALQKQADAMASGDAAEIFFGSVVTALQTQGSASRVDTYIASNCF